MRFSELEGGKGYSKRQEKESVGCLNDDPYSCTVAGACWMKA